LWNVDDPRRKELVNRRCTTAEEVAVWVRKVHDRRCQPNGQNGRDGLNGLNGQGNVADPIAGESFEKHSDTVESIMSSQSGQSITSISSMTSIKPATKQETYSAIAANAALVLVGVATALLDRQIKAQADKFVKEGGFTEKLYKTRQANRTP
jgi:four helix bundle suffix protein